MAKPDLFRSREYAAFRSSVAQKRLTVDKVEWKFFDAGPRSIDSPIVFVPPICGTADIYFKQMLILSAHNYRVISVELPVLWTVKDFCYSFAEFLNAINVSRVHLFGASLGGFLAMKFAEATHSCSRVHSMILCNAFSDTSFFRKQKVARSFRFFPGSLLKSMVAKNVNSSVSAEEDLTIERAGVFMLCRIDELAQDQLASRLTLNCSESYVQPHLINDLPVTIIDVFDTCAITDTVREDLYKCFPTARHSNLKSGGNFPYLSRAADVNMHIMLHHRMFEDTVASAKLPEEVDTQERYSMDVAGTSSGHISTNVADESPSI